MGGGGMAVPLCMQEEIQRGNWKRIWGEELGRGRGEEGEVLKGRWWWCWGRKGGEGMWGDAVSSSCMQMQLWPIPMACTSLFCLFPWPSDDLHKPFDLPLLWLIPLVRVLAWCQISIYFGSQHICMSGTQTQLPQKPFCIWWSKAGHFLLSSLRFCT